MSITSIIFMIIGGGIAFFGMSKQKKGITWGQPLALAGAVIAIAAALYNLVNTTMSDGTEAAVARERRYIKIQNKLFGAEILRQLPNAKKIAVIVDPSNYFDAYGDELAQPNENLQLEGLKEGMPGVELVEVYPKVPKIKKPAPVKGPDGEEIMPPPPMGMMDMMTAPRLKECAAKAKGADAVVVLWMLPPDLTLAQSLSLLKGMKVAVANVGDLQTLPAIFADGGKTVGELVAVVTTKASAVYDDKIASDEKEAFDSRYILITKDNYKTAVAEAQKTSK